MVDGVVTAPGAPPGESGSAGAPGITAAEAAARLAVTGPNTLPQPPTPSLLAQVAHHAAEPLSLVLVVAAAVSAAVLDHVAEGAAIVAIVALNVTIATVQERRAEAAVAALAALTAPTAKVLRDGVVQVVPADVVVPGDVVHLAAGDRVPADLRLVEASSFAVDEAVLTGESLPAEKVGGRRGADGQAFAATLAVRGRAVGVVERTGPATAVGAIAAALGRPTEPPLVGELRSVAAKMSLAAVVVGAVLVPVVYVRGAGDGDPLVDALLAGVALAVAAVPEGLATIVTTALALGARGMSRRGAIVRDLPAIEALGSATVICSDKTGTLTTGRLAVAAVVPAGNEGALWDAALRCNDAEGDQGDPIDVAISEAASARGRCRPAGGRVADRPFDTESRSMSTVHATADGHVLSIKGAPEVVLARCSPGPARDHLTAAVDDLTAAGSRVLAVASAPTGDLDAGGLTPVGLLAFHDPLRSSAAAAVADCRRAGIRIVLVTGDHVDTAVAVGRMAGLDVATPTTGAELAAADPGRRGEALRAATIVARVDPATKVDLVDAHRAAGEVVAMTGDVVNDAPALRRADIGVALAGEGGTDVAREAAGLVVTDGDLGTLVAAVREGRRIYRNIAVVVGYLLAGNISEVLVVLGSLALLPDLAVPLLPVQLLWVNLVTDGIPALALGVDRAPADPLAAPPRRGDGRLLGRRRLAGLVGRAVAVATAVLGAASVGAMWGWSDGRIRAQVLLALLAAHLLLAYAARARRATFERGWWRNRLLAAAVGGSLALQLAAFGTAAGRRALHLEALPSIGWLLAAAAALAAVVAIDAGRHLARTARRGSDHGGGTSGPPALPPVPPGG